MSDSSSKPLETLRDILDKILIVHYSCENLNDNVEGYSPIVTSIVVHDLKSGTSHSFSIHLEAEISNVSKADIEKSYDQLEKTMLEKFFQFARNKHTSIWLHWNMRNIHYGFETLFHRGRAKRISESNIPNIPDERRYNLSDIIIQKYGRDCVEHPRMLNLMQLNGGEPRGFLSGEDEVQAFTNKEFVKLHESNLSKVGWFCKIFQLLLDNKVKTSKNSIQIRIDQMLEATSAKLFSFCLNIILAIATIAQSLFIIYIK